METKSSRSNPAVAFDVWGTEIHCIGGRYSLFDLFKASRMSDCRRPAYFLKSRQAQLLIKTLMREAGEEPTLTDDDSGVYACKEIAISYASWVSPDFYIAVLRAFFTQNAPHSYTPTNLIRYLDFYGDRWYCVTDFSVPYFGMDSYTWAMDYLDSIDITDASLRGAVSENAVHIDFDHIGTEWFATRKAISHMITKCYDGLLESARHSLVYAFSPGHEPPLANAHDYPISPVAPPALMAQEEPPAQPTAAIHNLSEDGYYLLIVKDGEIRSITPLAGYNIVDTDVMRAIINNVKKLSQQCALLTGKDGNDLLIRKIDDVE